MYSKDEIPKWIETEIRADEREKVLDEFANWYRSKGYTAYDIGLLIKEYKKGTEMSEYPIVIVGENLREVKKLCREFAEQNLINGIERKGQAKWKINSNGKEYWILHRSYYEEWCKGRTYYKDGILMHSGYELKEQK